MHVTETVRVTISLKPGSVTEKVEISAQVTSVETTNATTGQSIGTETVRELPLATQNYQQLLTLSTGAQSDLNAAAQLGRGSVKLFVNGQREDNNNYLIDGISATDYNVAQATYVPLPNPDVIQEFKVQTSLYDASQGRNGGGNVNAILKSGTRRYHGDVYEFFRNDVLNANDFFLNQQGLAAALGEAEHFWRQPRRPGGERKARLLFCELPGHAATQRTFSGHVYQHDDSVASGGSVGSFAFREAFFGNATTAIDPVVLKLLQFQKQPVRRGDQRLLDPEQRSRPRARFAISRPANIPTINSPRTGTANSAAARTRSSARFFFSDSESLLPFGGGDLQESLGSTLASSVSSTSLNFPFDTPVHARFFNITETHLFSPTLVNEFRFGFVHINDVLSNVPPVTTSDVGIDRPTNSVTDSIYKFIFASSGFEIGPAPFGNQSQNQNNLNFVDTVSWVKGAARVSLRRRIHSRQSR